MIAIASSPINYRPDIDGLRALAVSLVVLTHAFPAFLAGGYIGVDIFFVISGYLIASIIYAQLDQGNFSVLDFYARRANRIFPALILVLTACLILGWTALFADEFRSLGKSVAAGAGFVANLNFYHEVGYWDVASKFKPLLHLWSLGVEEQFYFILPLLMWISWRYERAVFWVLLSCAMASFLWTLRAMNDDRAAAFYLPLHRAWELACGCILAYLTRPSHKESGRIGTAGVGLSKRQSRILNVALPVTRANIAATAGLVMIGGAACVMDESTPFPGKWSLLPVGGAVLLIAAGNLAWINRVVLSNKAVVYIGLISFPLYLWHWPLLSFMQIAQTGTPSTEMILGALVCAVLLASATHRWVEMPWRFAPVAHGAKAIAVTMLLAMVGAAGFFIYVLDGLPWRPVELKNATKAFTIIRPPDAGADASACFAALPTQFTQPLQAGKIPGTGVHCQGAEVTNIAIAMIGDSNAGHFANDLQAHYGPSMLTVHSAGRPFLTDFYTDDVPSQAIREFLVGQKQIGTIVLSHLGVGYVQGEFPSLTTPPVLNPDYVISLKKTIQYFQAVGKRVVLVLSIPILDFDPKRCLQRPYAKSNEVNPCSIPRKDVLISHGNYFAAVRNIRDQFPDLEIIDPMDYLCDKDTCYAKRKGIILYADRKHVNSAGSEAITMPLIELLDKGRQVR
jgi:peptidoglycan/LPS O-acetylase OafA/YrhL